MDDDQGKDVRSASRRAREENRKREERIRAALRAVTERPGDPKAQEEYRATWRDARSAAPWVPKAEVPDMQAEFDAARKGERKKAKIPMKATPALKVKPPTPAGMDRQAARQPQVSPQLRERTRAETKAELKKQILLKRDFRNAARDAFER